MAQKAEELKEVISAVLVWRCVQWMGKDELEESVQKNSK